MPFTPFHFGPGAAIALPLNRHIDLFAFLLANVVVDVEPLIVMTFSLSYPLHGYVHTFAGATLACLISGCILFFFKGFISEFMRTFVIKDYDAAKKRMILSSVLGGWFHILLDSMIYTDIRPFYPFSLNPFFGIMSSETLYRLCALAFIPAAAFYLAIRTRKP